MRTYQRCLPRALSTRGLLYISLQVLDMFVRITKASFVYLLYDRKMAWHNSSLCLLAENDLQTCKALCRATRGLRIAVTLCERAAVDAISLAPEVRDILRILMCLCCFLQECEALLLKLGDRSMGPRE